VVAFDDGARKVRLSLAQVEILKSLARDEALFKAGAEVPGMSSDQYVLEHIFA
jgi:glutamate--cysteine ligase catalytic subunit